MTGWVKCSERMPEVNENCWRTDFPLIIKCELGVIPAYACNYKISGKTAEGFKQSLRFGNGCADMPKEDRDNFIVNVTHWMPMPAHPIE